MLPSARTGPAVFYEPSELPRLLPRFAITPASTASPRTRASTSTTRSLPAGTNSTVPSRRASTLHPLTIRIIQTAASTRPALHPQPPRKPHLTPTTTPAAPAASLAPSSPANPRPPLLLRRHMFRPIVIRLRHPHNHVLDLFLQPISRPRRHQQSRPLPAVPKHFPSSPQASASAPAPAPDTPPAPSRHVA